MNGERKSLTGAGEARENYCKRNTLMPVTPGTVKLFREDCGKRNTFSALRCGSCVLFREGSRRFCAFLGESVRAADVCRVDVLSDAYAWIDALPVGGGL